MAIVTFNKIVKAFKDISDAHYQVNSFGIGDVWEIATSGTITYPLVWAVPQDSTLNGKIYSSNFTLVFMDLVHKDERNENEVLSDMELVAMDFVAQLQKPDYDFDFKPESISFKRFTERFDDEVSGVAVDITIRVPYIFDRCAIPSSVVNTESQSTSGYVTIIDINGQFITTVNAGGTYTVPCGLLAENNNQLYAD